MAAPIPPEAPMINDRSMQADVTRRTREATSPFGKRRAQATIFSLCDDGNANHAPDLIFCRRNGAGRATRR
jgi:hypothetical protein